MDNMDTTENLNIINYSPALPTKCHLSAHQSSGNLSGASPEHGQGLSRAWPEPETDLKSVADASLTLTEALTRLMPHKVFSPSKVSSN